MNRFSRRLLPVAIVGLVVSLSACPTTIRADWPSGGCCGYSTYSYGVGYYPYTASYWPSTYYVGYGSYSLWPSYSWGGCGSSCYGGCSSCGGCGSCYGGCSTCGSWCGSGCYGSSGCCGIGGCGAACGGSCCGGACGTGCGLACGPGCSGGCASGVAGAGCGATSPPPANAKPQPTPDGRFVPRTYDPDAPPEREPKSRAPGAAGAPPAAGADETGTGRPYSRDRSGDGTKSPAAPAPKDNFDAPIPKPPAGGPAAGTLKDGDTTFEAKKPPLVTVPQHGTDKKAPVTTPDDVTPDATPAKKSDQLKKPSAEIREDVPAPKKGPALTLQDRATWRLANVSRPLFGRIASRPAPIPQRLTSSSGDWAVFSADEAQVARR
jgi:hypothetical protein